MRTLTVSALAAILFAATTSFADDSKTDTTQENVRNATSKASNEVKTNGGYGPAGCGLGSMIFAPDSGFTQIFAATTNGSTGTQTFGISSGTSNCAGGPGGAKSAKAFIQTNREALAKDIARGSGETVASLSKLAGCKNLAAVGPSLQRNFKTIFPAASITDEQVSTNVLASLKANSALACSI